MMVSWMVLAVLLSQINPAAEGWSGWTAFGLAGMILGWLFLAHLPAKDKQIRELLEAASKERDLDRTARHGMSETLTRAIAEVRKDSDATRERDMERHEARFAAQSTEFRLALQGILKHSEDENKKLTDVFRTEIARITGANNGGKS